MTSWTNSTGWDGAPEEYFQSHEERLEESLYTGAVSPQDLTNQELDDLLNDPIQSPIDHTLRQEKDRRTGVNQELSTDAASTPSSERSNRDSISETELYDRTAAQIQTISQRVAGDTLSTSDLKDLVKQIHTEYSTADKREIVAGLHSDDHDRQEDALRRVGRDLGYI
ncbi:hypothetical protein [Halosegnis longus]|nr:hypothetical protein [Halosegnis longus]